MTSRLGDRLEWLFDEAAPKTTHLQFRVLAYQTLRLIDLRGKHWNASQTIADHLGMSERSVRRAQADLASLGFIERRFRYNADGTKKSTTIWVLAPGVHPDDR